MYLLHFQARSGNVRPCHLSSETGDFMSLVFFFFLLILNKRQEDYVFEVGVPFFNAALCLQNFLVVTVDRQLVSCLHGARDSHRSKIALW